MLHVAFSWVKLYIKFMAHYNSLCFEVYQTRWCFIMLHCIVLYFIRSHYTVLCYALSCHTYVMLYYILLCYMVLDQYYVILYIDYVHVYVYLYVCVCIYIYGWLSILGSLLPSIIQHLLFRVPKNDLNFDNYPYR